MGAILRFMLLLDFLMVVEFFLVEFFFRKDSSHTYASRV